VAQKLRKPEPSFWQDNLTRWANIRSAIPPAVGADVRTDEESIRDRSQTRVGQVPGRELRSAANLCAAAIGTETDGSVVCRLQQMEL